MNNRAKFDPIPNPICNDGALGFLKRVAQEEEEEKDEDEDEEEEDDDGGGE